MMMMMMMMMMVVVVVVVVCNSFSKFKSNCFFTKLNNIHILIFQSRNVKYIIYRS